MFQESVILYFHMSWILGVDLNNFKPSINEFKLALKSILNAYNVNKAIEFGLLKVYSFGWHYKTLIYFYCYL